MHHENVVCVSGVELFKSRKIVDLQHKVITKANLTLLSITPRFFDQFVDPDRRGENVVNLLGIVVSLRIQSGRRVKREAAKPPANGKTSDQEQKR